MPERFRRGLNGLLVLLILGALAYASALLFGWNCPIKIYRRAVSRLWTEPCTCRSAPTGLSCGTAVSPDGFRSADSRFVRTVWQKAAFRLQKPRAHAAVERYRAGYRNLADTSRAA